jgi:3-oxoacyl-[acyl-carrier protein] reductase
MTKTLLNKVALVTGASKGIGAAIAKQLAAEGAKVAVNYSSSKEDADRVVEIIKSHGGEAVAIQGNLSLPADVKRVVLETKKTYGPLDILVNNAGVYEFGPLDEITPDIFNRIFNLNVLGVMLVTQEAVRVFNPKGGSIINISSAVTSISPPNSAVYSASKGALDIITSVLSKELAVKNIRVNSVNPGMILTEGVQVGGEEFDNMQTWVKTTAPMARIGNVDEIAAPVAFLASDKSSYMTGAFMLVSGGLK